jgi:AraC-like DNA-binding protein
MPQTLRGLDPDRLERSCDPRRDSIRFAATAFGLERAEVHLSTCSFEPHRHDTYALGMTTSGVQTFHYRDSRRVSLPGQLQILHPDETHDGSAGTEEGFGYRVLYIAPELIHDALDGRPLPFVADPIQKPTGVTRLLVSLLADIDDVISDLRRVEIAAAVADMLCVLSGRRDRRRAVAVDTRAVELARDYLWANASEQTPASALEEITGEDRFTLARHFRRAFGTSPDRYRTMRRLELARAVIAGGLPLAQAAAQAGFSDQSHMTRQFKRAYGLTPARWRRLTSAPGSPRGSG